jgi:FKBP-type peptidyl-prolyl cis-trans isomerase
MMMGKEQAAAHKEFSKTVLIPGDGFDPYGNVVLKPTTGDWVKVHYKGRVKSTGKEFEDTYHRQKPAYFQVGAPDWMMDIQPTWNKGLCKAVQTMNLGESCRLEIKSDFAYGEK